MASQQTPLRAEHYYRTIEGAFDFPDLYQRMIAAAPLDATFVEVGSWLGCSTAFLAIEARNAGKRTRIFAVDTWQGSANEPDQRKRAEGADLQSAWAHNVQKSGYPVNAIRMPSVDAVRQFPDESLDFVFIDAAHDYASIRKDIVAWLPKVKRGGWLGGHDYRGFWRGVRVAVEELLPYRELQFMGSCWLWQKSQPAGASWVRAIEPFHYAIFVPFAANLPRLQEALAAIRPYWDRTVVLDQSVDGIPSAVWEGSVARWTASRRFTCVQNWMQRQSSWWRLPCYFFMHADAVCAERAVERMLDTVARHDGKWGLVFSQYDSFCCFNTEMVADVGSWDEAYEWYVADIDYYNRVRWRGWPCLQCPQAVVRHYGSQTLCAMSAEERASTQRHHNHAVAHYRHKWGCRWDEQGDGRVYCIPYNGRP